MLGIDNYMEKADVLLRRYWNHSTYMGAIEPYPRGAIGGNLGLAYNMNFKNENYL